MSPLLGYVHVDTILLEIYAKFTFYVEDIMKILFFTNSSINYIFLCMIYLIYFFYLKDENV